MLAYIESPRIDDSRELAIPVSLDLIIAGIHGNGGLEFPFSQKGSRIEESMEIISSRLQSMPEVRRNTAIAIERMYGAGSDKAGAARIVEAVGGDLDQIFFSQLLQKDQSPKSWRQYDPIHTTHLVETIDLIEANEAFNTYFLRNPQTKQMLQIIKKLALISDHDKLDTMTDELEMLAISQYKERKPAILFLLSDWYLRPNRGEDDIELLEPDCRLIFPYERGIHEAMIELVDTAREDLSAFYPDPQWEEPPTGVIGDTVMWAGSQLVSYTVGESFNGHGFMFSPNILKSRDLIVGILDSAGLPTPDTLAMSLVRQYVLHELGHSYFHVVDPFMVEMITDATTVMVFLRKALVDSELELRQAVGILIGEYIGGMGEEKTGEASNDGYRISSIFILEKLFEYQLVEILPNGRLQITSERQNCQKLIEELGLLHKKLITNDDKITKWLRAIEPSEKVLEISALSNGLS